MKARAIGVLLLVLLGTSCRLEGKRQAHRQVGANGEALRAAFNADLGKTRVLALVSPS